MCQFPWCKDSQWQISSCPHGIAEYRTRKKTGKMSSWIQYKSAPGPTESEAVPTGMTNEQVYKLQGKVGVLCVCVCVCVCFLSETWDWVQKSYTRHQELFSKHYRKKKIYEYTHQAIQPADKASFHTVLGVAKTSQISLPHWANMSTRRARTAQLCMVKTLKSATGSFEAGGFILMSIEWGMHQHLHLGQSSEDFSSAPPHPFASDTPLEHWNALLSQFPQGPAKLCWHACAWWPAKRWTSFRQLRACCKSPQFV